MAEETQIMVNDVSSYSLEFEGFSIEFDVHLQRSISETRAFRHGKPADFAFVVADIWLKSGNARCLVISKFKTDNLIEGLRELSEALGAPEKLGIARRLIPPGGLCAWMQEYWRKIAEDRTVTEDEASYDRLFSFCVVAEDAGCIAVYDRDGVSTIEVSAQAHGEGPPLIAVSQFTPAVAAHNAIQLRSELSTLIREQMVNLH